jgi:deazaflavin-dependent oxidoreductase (nitroreductase family)
MPLRYSDPTAPHSLLWRAFQSVANTPLARWMGIKVAVRVDPFLLKRTGGRVRMAGPLPTLLLTTRGAKSGAARENALVYFHDGEDVILIASNFGQDRNPAWYYNLLAHPDEARLNGESYSAVEEAGAERERLFALAVRLYPGYADYRRRTDAIGRTIPVMRLTPRP